MQMIESNYTQLTSLLLPSPALVIDTRGIEDDDVMDRLKIEIADLANEMKTQDIHHWRYLTDFLSFWVREPMSCDEVNTLRPKNADDSGSAASNLSSSDQTPPPPPPLSGLTGKIDPSTLKSYSSPFFIQRDAELAPLHEDRPADVLQQHISKIVQEIDRLRNNRHVAVADLEPTLSGRSIKDATVRVIFLTDAERPDSLATTAALAAYLNQVYARKEHSGQQRMINTIVICLNNSGEVNATPDLRELLWDDKWDHLDALILTEDYREDAASIAGDIQAYLAELLLYVLMIVPPLQVAADAPAAQSNSASSFNGTNGNKKGHYVPFPPATFLVGLSAIEHSARWGRRQLNYHLVEQAIEVMQKGTDDERKRAQNTATVWLNNWRDQVKSAIPDKVPGNIVGLQAISYAKRAIKPLNRIFTIKNFSLSIGKTTIEDLEQYQEGLAATYNFNRASQSVGSTLQEAVDSIPQIQQRLREWESKDPALRKGTPLVNAQLEAVRVLSHPHFFTGAGGAIPRAKMQLEELGTAISNFWSDHLQNPLDLPEKCKQLVEKGNDRIEALKHHIESIPFLASVLGLKQLLAWLTFICYLCLCIIGTFFTIAWIRHAITYFNTRGPRLPLPDLTPIINSVLLVSASPFAFLFWLIVLGIVLALFIYFGRKLLMTDGLKTPLRVELFFLMSLIVFALSGFVIGLSFVGLAGDPDSFALIAWLSYVPVVGTILLLVAFVIVLVEIVFFIWWYRHLQEERERIVNELDAEHLKNIDDVVQYIGDVIALHLLLRAKLTNERGGLGEYFQRINQLNLRLRDILENAQKQQSMARKRLTMSVSETQLGAGVGSNEKWLNLRTREELLDVNALADGINSLTEVLDQEPDELKEFAQLLLRVLGEETAAEIERDFRENMAPRGSVEQHNAQILMTTLVAMALRLSINATSISSMTPLIRQYDNIVNSLAHQPTAMKSLIESLRKKVRQNMLQPIMERSMRPSEIETYAVATNAMAAWAQMLWESRDKELQNTLSPKGVMPKLLEDSNNAHMVKRKLALRTSLFGRNAQSSQIGTFYLLLPSSPQAHQFRQELNLPSRYVVSFPDVERLVLLYVKQYVGQPLFLPAPDANQTANGSSGSNGVHGASASADATPSSSSVSIPSPNGSPGSVDTQTVDSTQQPGTDTTIAATGTSDQTTSTQDPHATP